MYKDLLKLLFKKIVIMSHSIYAFPLLAARAHCDTTTPSMARGLNYTINLLPDVHLLLYQAISKMRCRVLPIRGP